ncbi:hypothetical protein NL676_004981 [Syzygium grande]|nr:hypothetical protein NL676_004981 [Syzygium grande]
MPSTFYCLLIVLILFSACVATGKNLDGYYIPKLSVLPRTFIQDPTWEVRASVSSKDFQTFFYNQTLDHFNYRPESYTTFKQRYVINFKYWGGTNASAPIFVYFGGEEPIDIDMAYCGFPMDNAGQFRALVVYVEHRFYGESIPYGLTLKKALSDPNTRGYFSSAQALADYAEILVYLKQKLNAKHSPVIVIGGSYGGKPLKSSSELKDYLISLYGNAAQYNDPFTRRVKVMCDAIDGASPKNDILGKIFAGVIALIRNSTCYINRPFSPSQTDLGWDWQTCTEILFPDEITSDNTMFQPQPFDLNELVNNCKRKFGVAPRPHWATTYYSGHDIELVLHRFASNIVFSNGLQDPWSKSGILKNISSTVVAVYTTKGSHCLDIIRATEKDPIWLVKQRKTEVEIIRKWMATYYADLRAFGK